ncbi:MAG: glycosyltransferase family 2 protein [Microcystis aeruginosa BS13-10]|nr:glycosyltransferase family 2 protein [Microcystis aeruginosa BS13-10]
MIDFSVVICTYNGAAKLPTLLERLRSQRQIDNLNWEILIVDNNSNDGTAKLIAEYQRGWDRSYPLRYCFEARQGLAFARRLAVREAQGELLGFLDDDNWPADDWVATAYSFGQCHPQAGRVDSFKLSTADFESINLTEDSQVYLSLTKRVSHNN